MLDLQDLNGNHVVQRCLQKLDPEYNQFIYDAVVSVCMCVCVCVLWVGMRIAHMRVCRVYAYVCVCVCVFL